MKTELFTTALISDKIMMIDPEGCDQNEDILQLIKQREEIDKEISKLVKQRKEFNDLIVKNCNHPIEKRAIDSWYLTDTIGNNGWDELRLICRDCGKTLKDGRSYEDIWKKSKLNYFEIGNPEMETIIKAGKDGECLLDLRNIKYEIKNYIVFTINNNMYKKLLIKIKEKQQIDNNTLKIKFEVV